MTQSVQEIYRSAVSGLSSEERLELAALILRKLAAATRAGEAALRGGANQLLPGRAGLQDLGGG
jgi:hypothetical protein